jgi:oligopeptide/dipeptide ABC transporter ATP-binding protein
MIGAEHPVLSVENLEISFPTKCGNARVVGGVSFQIGQGETLGIVGESGSGKSMTGLAILGLLPAPGFISAGSIRFEGLDMSNLSNNQLRSFRGSKIAMIFQDPMTSLNPFMPVWKQIAEVTQQHQHYTAAESREHAIKMLHAVGIPDAQTRANSYPHQFSGGMRQRVMIAMALACNPHLLIADEPTTALDVTIQAQILELLHHSREENTAVILITHDLGVVAQNTDRVIVMYAGRIMESASSEELFSDPQHPYTRALLRCIPDLAHRDEPLFQIAGQPPMPSTQPQQRCPFVERCPESVPRCRDEYPPYHHVGNNHWSLCWLR